MISKKGLLIHPEEMGDYWLKQLENSGLNLLGIHPVGGNHAVDSLNGTIPLMEAPESMAFFNKLCQMSFELEFELHAISWLLPRNLINIHQNWFRMNEKGERTEDFNLCPSNKDALAYVEERAGHLAKILKPTTNRYFFWTDDVKDAHCCCSECRKYSPSDQAMILYNTILRGIKRVDPKATHCYLAYHETMLPPLRVEPEDGIFLEFAPIRRDSSIPIHDPGNSGGLLEIAAIKELLACFGGRSSQVLEYWIDNSRFSDWKKPPKKLLLDADTMKRDVEFYHSLGFESITSFACYLGEDYFQLYGRPPIKEYGEILAAYT